MGFRDSHNSPPGCSGGSFCREFRVPVEDVVPGVLQTPPGYLWRFACFCLSTTEGGSQRRRRRRRLPVWNFSLKAFENIAVSGYQNGNVVSFQSLGGDLAIYVRELFLLMATSLPHIAEWRGLVNYEDGPSRFSLLLNFKTQLGLLKQEIHERCLQDWGAI